MERRVSKNFAIYLKQIGYKLPVNCQYHPSSNEKRYGRYINHNEHPYDISAPTVEEAIWWLREEKSLHVACTPFFSHGHTLWEPFIYDLNKNAEEVSAPIKFKSAFSEGYYHSLGFGFIFAEKYLRSINTPIVQEHKTPIENPEEENQPKFQ